MVRQNCMNSCILEEQMKNYIKVECFRVIFHFLHRCQCVNMDKTCINCRKTFARPSTFRRHMLSRHNTFMEPLYVRPVVTQAQTQAQAQSQPDAQTQTQAQAQAQAQTDAQAQAQTQAQTHAQTQDRHMHRCRHIHRQRHKPSHRHKHRHKYQCMERFKQLYHKHKQ